MSTKKRSNKQDGMRRTGACPCGSDKSYAACCEQLHNGAPAGSAEALMRSRYSAFVLDLPEYLQRSWHSSVRNSSVRKADTGSDAGHDSLDKMRWLRLQIKRHEPSGDDRAIVEFIAHYKVAGRAYALHEISRFVREEGHWFYVDGQVIDGQVME
ncbi:MAG TPA: YchJ family metal-binding protein [Spongiibacteraceae bacterium]|nr:YchJ family metal-binding protein [Spongiibacteraceae bacterium]